MRKLLTTFIAAILILTGFPASSFADTSGHIKMADAGWDSIRFHNAVVGYIAENGYGLTWEEVPGSTPITYEALKNKEIDVYTEIWTDNLPSYDTDVDQGLLLDLGVNFDDNKQGIYVPTYVIKGDPERGIKPMAPDLKTVSDLKNYADVFVDEENPDKGRLYGAIPGWEADTVVKKKYYYNNLDENFIYFSPGSETALSAAFVSAYEKGLPIVGYNWEPTWMTGIYDLTLLEDEPYSEAMYAEGKTAFPSVKIAVGARVGLDKDYPEFVNFLRNYHTSSQLTADALGYIESEGASFEEAAQWFISENPELIKEMVSEDAWSKIQADASNPSTEGKPGFSIYKFPFTWQVDTDKIDRAVRSFATYAEKGLSAIKNSLNSLLNNINLVLSFIPWWLYALGAFLSGYKSSKKLSTGLIYAALVYFIGMIGLWDMTMITLSIIITSVLISLLLGFPIGILISINETANVIVRPILDAMQTMPIFVYLIPAVLLFGLGRVPGVIATVIYAIVPIIRLTNLGIRQVDSEIVEASVSFGASRFQTMVKVQIPQAFPTIMAGVNQTLMMAMAMVVTTSMIGVSGLGLEVLYSVNRIEVGRGLVSGTAVVIVAILLDRISQSWIKDTNNKGGKE